MCASSPETNPRSLRNSSLCCELANELDGEDSRNVEALAYTELAKQHTAQNDRESHAGFDSPSHHFSWKLSSPTLWTSHCPWGPHVTLYIRSPSSLSSSEKPLPPEACSSPTSTRSRSPLSPSTARKPSLLMASWTSPSTPSSTSMTRGSVWEAQKPAALSLRETAPLL